MKSLINKKVLQIIYIRSHFEFRWSLMFCACVSKKILCFRLSCCKELQHLCRFHIKEIFIVNVGREIQKLQERQFFFTAKWGKPALQYCAVKITIKYCVINNNFLQRNCFTCFYMRHRIVNVYREVILIQFVKELY